MTTARQRVLNYLKKQRSASAAQIGRGLNMSAATVRHHLSIMVGDRRIIVVGARRTEKRGRPVKLYRVSDKLIGDNLAMLSDVVLIETLNKLSPAKQNEFIKSLAKNLTLQMKSNDFDVTIAKRIGSAIESLNKFYYQARWEAGSQGPQILFAHCPYAAIIDQHPELCRMDEMILGELIGLRFEQFAKIGKEPADSNHCIFRSF